MKQKERAASALADAIVKLRSGCMKLDECRLELQDLPQTSNTREIRTQLGRMADYVDRSTRTIMGRLCKTGLLDKMDEEIMDKL